jgi:hypothetical protein
VTYSLPFNSDVISLFWGQAGAQHITLIPRDLAAPLSQEVTSRPARSQCAYDEVDL